MTLRILCSGDIHLGRLPTRVPWDSLHDENQKYSLTQEAALERLVQHAISEKVHAVMLSGDIIDQANAYFEGVAALESQLRKLEAAGIPVYAVAGNHDWKILSDFADNVAGCTLLGRDGTWESRELVHEGNTLAYLHGRSFTERFFYGDPTEGLVVTRNDIPNIVLLHADVGAPADSSYAPVSLQRLKQYNDCSWLLGHIHKPQVLSEDPLIFYPGSLLPLDPGETGSHGASLLTFPDGQTPRHRHLPLASLRYESIEIDLGGAEEGESLDPVVHKTIKTWIEENRTDLQGTERVLARLQLTGRVPSLHEIEQYRIELSERREIHIDTLAFTIDSIVNRCELKIPLEELSESQTPPGLLAQKILILKHRQPTDAYGALLSSGKKRVQREIERSHGAAVDLRPWEDEETVRELLLESSFLLLDAFLRQKEETA